MSDTDSPSEKKPSESAPKAAADAAKPAPAAKKPAGEEKARDRGSRPEDLEAAEKKKAFQLERAAKAEPKASTAMPGGEKRVFEVASTGEDKLKAANPAAANPANPAQKKPAAPKQEFVPPPPEVLQRRFVMRMLGWAGLAGFFSFLGGLATRFFWPRTIFEPPTAFVAGYPSEFSVGEVNTTFQNAYRVWIVRETTGIYALIAKCTHLGCTPVWIEAKNKFKCPCHGSGFTKEGINFEGPAPRPLERASVALRPDGRLFVDTAKVFRKEREEWSKAGSYVTV